MNNKVNSFCLCVSHDYPHTYFFYKKGRGFSRNDFCLFYKTKPRSYWGTILSRFYLHYTRFSFNPHRFYRKFYRKEYRTYADFLSGYFYLSEDEIDMCINTSGVLCKDLYVDPDSTIQYFDYVDDCSFGNPYNLILDYFNRILEDEN